MEQVWFLAAIGLLPAILAVRVLIGAIVALPFVTPWFMAGRSTVSAQQVRFRKEN